MNAVTPIGKLTDDEIMEVVDKILAFSCGMDFYDYVSGEHWWGDRYRILKFVRAIEAHKEE